MFTWVAVMLVCSGPVVTQCRPLVFGETFYEALDCQTVLQNEMAAVRDKGLAAYGSCQRVKLDLTLL